ncbi:aspartate aminotransferase family protein [Desulfurivibrio sp. C05AmB]|uniref:aspartate aminotransferase family protein n=1 Tax=Desulfurivibrio sp. C05AmB TaxID=3374371 RepID=UPI00376EEE90
MTGNSAWNQRGDGVLMNTYGRLPVTMVRGSGCLLYDADGREYLDFVAGIAVCNLGHCHPAVTAAITEQAGQLVHVSNLYHTTPQIELAETLCAHSFAERVFFCNSGAEANEAAIKLARKASPAGKYEIISLAGSFHGRTLATVAATGQSKFHEGFEPLPRGFIHAPFGDIAALESLIGPATCAVLCEPLQGEGGVRPLAQEYLRAIRELCDRHKLLLIFDEVQVGMGRTGTLLAHEQLGVVPDMLTLAKGLGNGLPIGALLARDALAAAFTPGSHASTFGGNPVACRAAGAVLQIMLAPDFLPMVRARGRYLAARLGELAARFPAKAAEVRGMGLIQGLVLREEFRAEGPAIVRQLFEQGLLLNFAGNTALRFLPPLVVSEEEIDRAVALVADALA